MLSKQYKKRAPMESRLINWCKKVDPVLNFFQKIVGVVLTIFVAIMALWISNKQADISRAQLQTNILLQKPSFRIQQHQSSLSSTIEILSVGPDAVNPEFDAFAFWQPQSKQLSPKSMWYKHAMVPLTSYFGSRFSDGSKLQHLEFLTGDMRAWNETINLVNQELNSTLNAINVRRFVRAKYSDRLGNRYTEFLEVVSNQTVVFNVNAGHCLYTIFQAARSGNFAAVDYVNPDKTKMIRLWATQRRSNSEGNKQMFDIPECNGIY